MKNKNNYVFLKFINISFIVWLVIYVCLYIYENFGNSVIINYKTYELFSLLFILYFIFLIISSIICLIKYKNKVVKRNLVIPVIIIIIFLLYILLAAYSIISQKKAPQIEKPIIYIYPTRELNLTVKLKNSSLLTSTYPKYNYSWDIVVNKNGNIYDKKTKRNYYGLYYEAVDKTRIDMEYGFVIKGDDTVDFLEEKLEILGLNEREINEFIIYWLPKMENNRYNYIRFRTDKEIEKYMPLEFNINPETIIRVIMDYKPLDKKIKIKEQKLVRKKRSGFTVVEWGARELKEE